MKFNKIDNFSDLYKAIIPEISVDPKTGRREVKLANGGVVSLNTIAKKIKLIAEKLEKKNELDTDKIEFGYKCCQLVDELHTNGKKEIERLEASDKRFITVRIRSKILSFFANLFSNPKKDILTYQKKHFPFTPPNSEASFSLITSTDDIQNPHPIATETKEEPKQKASNPSQSTKTPPSPTPDENTQAEHLNFSESSDSEIDSPKKQKKMHFDTLIISRSATNKRTLKRTRSVGAKAQNIKTLKPLNELKIPTSKQVGSIFIKRASDELVAVLTALPNDASQSLLKLKDHWLDPQLKELLPIAFIALDDTSETVELKKLVPSLEKITVKMYLEEAKGIFLKAYQKKSIKELWDDDEIEHTPLEFFVLALLSAVEKHPVEFRGKHRNKKDWQIVKQLPIYFDDRAQIGKGRCSPKFLLCPSAENPDHVCLKLIDHPDVFYYPIEAFVTAGPIMNGLREELGAKFITKKGQAKRDAAPKKKKRGVKRAKPVSEDNKSSSANYNTMVISGSQDKDASSSDGEQRDPDYSTVEFRPDLNYKKPTFD